MNNLERFLKAQGRDYEIALNEIKNGQKQSHWIWYIFPQIAGLGTSSTSQYYGIKDLAEAQALADKRSNGDSMVSDIVDEAEISEIVGKDLILAIISLIKCWFNNFSSSK